MYVGHSDDSGLHCVGYREKHGRLHSRCGLPVSGWNGILAASYGQIIHYGSCAGTVRFAGYIDGAHGERGVSGDGGYHAFQAAGECGQADPENASSK